MLNFLFAPANTPFAVALTVMMAFAFLEGVTSVFGQALSGLIEGFLPDMDASVDIDSPTAIDGEPALGDTALSRLLGWLHIGRVPVLVLLVLFLTCFGLGGYILQALVTSIASTFIPPVIASLLAAFVAILMVRSLGGVLGRVLPSDETSAVSGDSFIGRIAVIIRGTARQGSPAEAKLTDQHGAAHYILLEPDMAAEELMTGEPLLVVARRGATYRAIRNPSSAMSDGT